MAKYRTGLPQLEADVFLTDSGLETDLIFHHGYDLPLFAAFVLLEDERGTKTLRDYYEAHAAIAQARGVGFILESATWRASPDWAERLGYSPERLAAANRRAIEMLIDIRTKLGEGAAPLVVSGQIGPRGDGYQPAELMTKDDAQRYHSTQVGTFAETDADLVTALTMTYAAEAIGVTRAAVAAGIPVVISFTVETEGALPDGSSLRDAIVAVDDATDGAPAYYMLNCAHPTHYEQILEPGAEWTARVRGMRANASRRSHAELDNAEDLDDGNPRELGAEYSQLRGRFPKLTVLGGCCGTDRRHVEEIATACLV